MGFLLGSLVFIYKLLQYTYEELVRERIFDIQGGDGFFTIPLHSTRTATYVTGFVGTRKLSILIDSGSDHFWIKNSFSSQENQLRRPADGRPFIVEYAGGIAAGVQGIETFSLGTVTWTQTIGIVDATTDQLRTVVSVLGLSRQCRDPRLCAITHWRLLIPVVGFVYDVTLQEGLFLAGHIDKSLCLNETKITWLKQPSNSFFWTSDIAVEIATLAINSAKAVWDTGTSYIYFADALYEAIMALLPKPDEYCAPRDLPPLRFVLNGSVFELPAILYASRAEYNRCNYHIGRLDKKWTRLLGAEILLGWIFIQTSYVIFDIQNDQIGICPSQSLEKPLLRRGFF